jgi:hypothetical protein
MQSPETAEEHVAANVRRAVATEGITYPVAMDNDTANWNAWGNR